MQVLTFKQTVPTATWTITHNFGTKPTLDVWVDYQGGREKILPSEVVHLSDNITQINFTESFTGSVRLVASGYPVTVLTAITNPVTP
jgi:hypothetical protein